MVDTRLPVQTILPQADVEMLMHQPVRTCRPEDTLAEAARLMWEADCGIVPVVSPDRVLLGVLTDRDVCMAAWLQGQTLSSIPMGSVMQTRVETVHPESTPEEAHSLMRQRGIRRLPVVDHRGRLLGIISLNDLACHAQPATGKQVRQEKIQIAWSVSAIWIFSWRTCLPVAGCA